MAYRTSKQASTRYSPYYLTHGRKAKLPIHYLYNDTSMKQDVPAQVILDEADKDNAKVHLEAINNLGDTVEYTIQDNIQKAYPLNPIDWPENRHTMFGSSPYGR